MDLYTTPALFGLTKDGGGKRKTAKAAKAAKAAGRTHYKKLNTTSALFGFTKDGGGKAAHLQYKKYLEKKTVGQLQKSAVRKGIKITKKKDGKTVYIKKATLIKKLCDLK